MLQLIFRNTKNYSQYRSGQGKVAENLKFIDANFVAYFWGNFLFV
jgi:hypothetical protein